MTNLNIIEDIDNAMIESEMCVIESMISTYHKALIILEHSESSEYYDIIQESKTSGDNIIVKMFKAIVEFFKRLGNSISSFLNKSKASITERLRKFNKAVDSNEDYTETQNKIDNISESKSESINKKIKDDLVKQTNDSDNKNKDKKTGIIINERKIKTRIIFKEWIKFLSDIEEILDNFLNDRIYVKKEKLMYKVYSIFSHKYPASEVADDVDKIVELLKSINVKNDKALTKISEIQKAYDEELQNIKKNDKLSYKENKKYMKNVMFMASCIEETHTMIVSMTAELASELDLYGIILDVIEPTLKNNKDNND